MKISFILGLAGLGAGLVVACGGKVVFDGLPAGAGGASDGSSTHAASTTTNMVAVVSSATTASGPMTDAVSTVGVTTGTGGCGSFTTMNPQCDSCLQTNCCAEALLCTSGTVCDQDIMCTAGCGGDPTCLMKCASTFSQGELDKNALNQCLNTNCAGECALQGGICDSGLTSTDPKCDLCLTQNCCAQFDQCSGGNNGSDMAKVMQCLQDCMKDPPGPTCAAALMCATSICMCP